LSLRLPETGLAVLIAAALALAGDLVLRRRSASLSSWFESFWVGGGIAASALFPLSLVLPGRALGVLEAAVGAAAAAALVLRFRTGRPPASPEPMPAEGRPLLGDPLSAALLAITAAACVGFAALNWRYTYLWDGFQVWAARAQVLYAQGDLVPHLLPNDYFNRLLLYPPLVPLSEAFLARLSGGFDFDALKPVFLVFYGAMVVATWRAARGVAPRPLAFAATALLCLSPMVSTQSAAGGYADLPQAACVAAVTAAFLAGPSASGWRSPLPWLVASLVTVKQEGTVLAVICCGVAALAVAAGARTGGRATTRSAASFLAPIALFLILRRAYVRWVDVSDLTYSPVNSESLPRAMSRLGEVLRLCAKQLLDFRSWGLFWIAFLLAAVYLLAAGASSRLRIVAGAVLLAVISDMAIFLFTNWPVPLHIEQAFPRLLQQVAPAAAVVIAGAFAGALARNARRQEDQPEPSTP
jgi:hypothetical protein